MPTATVVFHNGDHLSAWRGHIEAGVLWFDFANDRGVRRFFVMPDRCVMFADESDLADPIPNAAWFVHIVDAYERDPERRIWLVEDRELDVVIEDDLRTYRVVDLDDFGDALHDHQIPLSDARRLLKAMQSFLDDYLHGGGKFPPGQIAPWLDTALDARPVDMDLGAFLHA